MLKIYQTFKITLIYPFHPWLCMALRRQLVQVGSLHSVSPGYQTHHQTWQQVFFYLLSHLASPYVLV